MKEYFRLIDFSSVFNYYLISIEIFLGVGSLFPLRQSFYPKRHKIIPINPQCLNKN